MRDPGLQAGVPGDGVGRRVCLPNCLDRAPREGWSPVSWLSLVAGGGPAFDVHKAYKISGQLSRVAGSPVSPGDATGHGGEAGAAVAGTFEEGGASIDTATTAATAFTRPGTDPRKTECLEAACDAMWTRASELATGSRGAV